MKLTKTKFQDLVILKPNVYFDNRGFFMESFHKKNISKLLGEINFVQDNISFSKRGVLRGLHFQNPPYTQSKLVSCLFGEILEVAVDLRKSSKTFGKSFTTILSAENKNKLFIPKGFAHGYVVLSKSSIISYKVDEYYNPEYESGVLWSDDFLNIDWKINDSDLIISEKDKNLLMLSKINIPFK